MEYEWYADLFFLEEAYRDVLVLWLAAVLGRKRIPVFRLLMAGIIGGLCGTMFFYLELSGIAAGITGKSPVIFGAWEGGKTLFTGFLMLWAAFPRIRLPGERMQRVSGSEAEDDSSKIRKSKETVLSSKKQMDRKIHGWKAVLFRRGKELGLLILSAGILQSGLAVLRERCFLTGWKSLLFMGFFCTGVRFFAAALVKRPVIGKTRYRVRIFLNGKSKEFTAMEDSGNRLVEPVTGKPVSIIAASDVKEFGSEKAGVLMIPYRAVGTRSGMLPGVIFDRMEIMDSENESVRIDRPVVAISKEPLFFGKDFTMILPERLFTDQRR